MSRIAVELIPWDPESPEHAERLIEQRLVCGWHADKVEGPWRKAQIDGTKCIYWVKICEDDPNYTARLETHTAAFPKQRSPIRDTSTRIRDLERHPTNLPFNPVGHISLDMVSPGLEHLNLDMPDTGAVWIKTLYVSDALQSSGVGRAAMDALEELASDPPFCARTLMLDTISKEDQVREDFATAFYGHVPKVSNESWYARRGYRVIKAVQNHYTETDSTGKRWDMKTVFMRRDLG